MAWKVLCREALEGVGTLCDWPSLAEGSTMPMRAPDNSALLCLVLPAGCRCHDTLMSFTPVTVQVSQRILKDPGAKLGVVVHTFNP